MGDAYKTETGEEVSFTIGDYLTMITATFPNPTIITCKGNPSQDLKLSIKEFDPNKW
ncbi:hypothetical protein FACS189428_1250 [Clostridia bacterium]|nr:hypothetical protein FACS189428_1250 [Clostridia bacterium]